jgi:nucleotide-binding universal stress UspA family protein
MDRILIPLDGSRVGNSAIDYVVGRKFELMDTDIHLINVQPPLNLGKIAQILIPDEIAAMRLAAGWDVLRPAQEALKTNGIRCTGRVLVGRVAEAIVRYAAAYECTSIVMGTKGMKPFKTFIQGSVPTTVVHLTTVPVTLVKHHGRFHASFRMPHRSQLDHSDADPLRDAAHLAQLAPRKSIERPRSRTRGRAAVVVPEPKSVGDQ